MRARPAVLTLTLTILALLIGLPIPNATFSADTTYSADRSQFADIQDDDPNPLPRYASPEDKQLLHELLESRAIQAQGLEALDALVGPPSGVLWTPAEYDEMSGVLVRWGSYNSLLAEFVVEVSQPDTDAKAWVLVENSSQESSAYSTLQGAGADMSNVEFITYDGDSVWIRDYGPRYTYEDSALTVTDFTYNRPTRPKDDAFNEALAALWSQPIYDMGLVRGGGNLHVLSTGDAFVSNLALDPDEDGTNEYTQAEIEQAYLDYLNVDVTIYERLPDSIDSTGHIDMWMLPLSDTDILVSQFSGGTGKTITDAGAADLESKGYTVWRVPAWNSGSTHYTYTNAAIVNNKVFIPWYSGYSSQNAAALSVFQTAMPGYEIIQVDTSSVISAAGAIHCVMKHVPAEIGVLISGSILDSVATPIQGVLLSADNGGGSDTTDSSGYYEVSVPEGWSGTITPTKLDYTFAPTSRSYSNVTADIAAEDYTGTFVGTTLVLLGPDDFETGFGNYSDVGGDDFDWARDSGGTPSSGTGPSVDHTTGTSSGFYLYTEASDPNYPNMTALLESSCITNFTGFSDAEVSFYYHMLGSAMGTLYVDVATDCSAPSWTNVFSVSGDQGDIWHAANVDLAAYIGGEIELRFRGVTGGGYQSDIAIDDVEVTASTGEPGNTKNILLTGFWPPSNEMLRKFSPDPVQNPDGWQGQNWEGRGYDVYAYFPEFPGGTGSNPKGDGDFEVDYQDVSDDFWRITDDLHPVAILSYGQGAGPWEIEYNARNLSSWSNDYQSPTQPTPAPPDSSEAAGYVRQSTLPVQEIADAINDAGIGVNAWVDWSGNPGAFLCEYMAYHDAWYQSLHSDVADSHRCLVAGFTHVASNVSVSDATEASEIALRETIYYLDSQLGSSCGDGVPEGTEECDDGNTADGDCCSATCQYESFGSACDDGVGCTEGEACDGAGTCQGGTPNDAPCDNGLYCDGVETCDAVLGCQAGTAVDCSDDVSCTVDSCNEASDSCESLPNDALCDDGDVCNGAEICDDVLDCQAGTPLDPDDGVSCTVDSCDPVTGVANVPNDARCDNGLYCDGAETCDALAGCQGGAAPCSDGVGCTVDNCDEGSDSCAYVPSDALCDDGDVCTGVETCDAALDCQAGTPLDPDDGVACTDDVCDPVTGVANVPNDGNCDNGFFCDGAEICDAVLDCQAGSIPCAGEPCDEEADVCTSPQVDVLNESFDSDAGPFSYQDDTFRGTVQPAYASGIWTASGGFSGGGLSVVLGQLDDDDINGMSGGWQTSFTLALAQELELSFRYNLTQTSEYESDELSQVMATLDGVALAGQGPDYIAQITGNGNGGSSESTGWVLFTLNLGTLDPGNHTLTIGGYNNKKTYNNESTEVLIDDVLVEGSGGCSVPADCDDGLFCNGVEDCVAGLCAAGTAVDCSDGVACTKDSCNEETDSCESEPNDAACDDANVCNGLETCDTALGCRAGTSPAVDDGVACTVDSCDPVTGVANLPNDAVRAVHRMSLIHI